MTRVLVSASSPVLRAGLESLIASTDGVSVQGRPFDPRSLAFDVDALHPDVVIIAEDAEDDDVLSSAQTLLAAPRAPAIIAVRERVDPQWASEALRAGVRVVLPRDATADELRAAIGAAATGLAVVPAELASAIFAGAARRAVESNAKPLTPREIEVLHMLAGGMGNKAIAQRLGISSHTVKYHVGSIMTKLSAASRTEAVTIGLRQGLVLL